MGDIFKIAVIGVLGTLLALRVKKDNPANALLITLAAGVTVIFIAMRFLVPVKNFLDEFIAAAAISPAIISPLFKVLGIAIVTKISAEACRDAKEGAIGAYIEIAGSAAAVYVSLPLLSAVLGMIKALA